MIISVSRRTDIPAFYSDWFFNRLNEGYVLVRNPINKKQLSKVSLSKRDVDCFVFWTKNPTPFLSRINELDGYDFYFQFTINSYSKDLELNVPTKKNIIQTFIKLSERIGSKRVIWRYDPIILSEKYSIDYHLKYFDYIASQLYGYTEKCVISFIDMYKKCEKNLKDTDIKEFINEEKRNISKNLSLISRKYNIVIETCAESVELDDIGINHNKCIDDELISAITGKKVKNIKDKNQRLECGCIESVDIGEYNTCIHNCLYCYANFNMEQVKLKHSKHDKSSPILIGKIMPDDIIKERKNKSIFDINRELFDL